MKKLQRKKRISYLAAGILLLSIILMIIIIPGILNDTYHRANAKGAAMAILMAITIHLLIFIWYIILIKRDKPDSKKRKAGYIVIGILLIFFGLIYMDGAFAFTDHKNILYVSFFMFTSTFCDLVASILIFTTYFLKPQKIDLNPI